MIVGLSLGMLWELAGLPESGRGSGHTDALIIRIDLLKLARG